MNTCTSPTPSAAFFAVTDRPFTYLEVRVAVELGVLRWVSWNSPAVWLRGLWPASWVGCDGLTATLKHSLQILHEAAQQDARLPREFSLTHGVLYIGFDLSGKPGSTSAAVLAEKLPDGSVLVHAAESLA